MGKKKTSVAYRIIRAIIRAAYPKIKVEGVENLPDEPAIIVANHCQLYGPVAAELDMPNEPFIWCAGEMMRLKEVPQYAYRDFWSYKPRWTKPFYKMLSYVIAPLSVCIFNNARTIAVYRDARVVSTFKDTLRHLKEGDSVVIFPEHDVKSNNIVYDFQDKFIDVARLYYKNTGKQLAFVPTYIAPKLKTMYFGKPTVFDADAPIDGERERICNYLMDEITKIGRGLPEHTVIPYGNVARSEYPSNKDV